MDRRHTGFTQRRLNMNFMWSLRVHYFCFSADRKVSAYDKKYCFLVVHEMITRARHRNIRSDADSSTDGLGNEAMDAITSRRVLHSLSSREVPPLRERGALTSGEYVVDIENKLNIGGRIRSIPSTVVWRTNYWRQQQQHTTHEPVWIHEAIGKAIPDWQADMYSP